jgi:prepilin-type N-terminal cleavage/methylation domain-containing protein
VKQGARAAAGVTLVEMLIVIALIGLMAAIAFPSVSSGIDSLRLTAAADSVSSLFNEALNVAERRQQAVEITISKADRTLRARSAEPGFDRTLTLPQGISITAVLPEALQGDDGPRRFLVYPGGTAPRTGIEMTTSRGARRIVRIDPITGVPRIEQPEQ